MMKDERFKIYVEQLRDGHTEELKERFESQFINIKERDLAFLDPVSVEGETYLAENSLIVHFDIQTVATIPCSICNEPVKVKIEKKDFYHAEPLEQIKSGIYDFQEILREDILLETPKFAECNQGNCPHREEVKKFLKKSRSEEQKRSGEEDGYQPFANLKWDD